MPARGLGLQRLGHGSQVGSGNLQLHQDLLQPVSWLLGPCGVPHPASVHFSAANPGMPRILQSIKAAAVLRSSAGSVRLQYSRIHSASSHPAMRSSSMEPLGAQCMLGWFWTAGTVYQVCTFSWFLSNRLVSQRLLICIYFRAIICRIWSIIV